MVASPIPSDPWIWKIMEVSKFCRLIETLPATTSHDALGSQSTDLTLMLLHSMPEEVRNYAILHAAGDDYFQNRTPRH